MFVELISKILVYPPKERLRPLEAILHPFFNDLRQEQFGIPNVKLPEFFDFQKGIAPSIDCVEELSIQPEIAHKLVPQW
jgi:glycogen synthase kinase 3 beta